MAMRAPGRVRVGWNVSRVTPYMARLLHDFVERNRCSRGFTFFVGKRTAELIEDPLLHVWLWRRTSKSERTSKSDDYGAPVGYGHIQLSDNLYKAHIGRLGVCVDEGSWGEGLGTEIVGYLLQEAAMLNLKKLVATVYADVRAMLHIYKNKYGFLREGYYRHEEIWPGPWVRDVVSLAKFLDSQ